MTPSPSRLRRERERVDARTTILEAARTLAREEGWDAVSMRRLAEAIGYSANYAYRYFAGREDILLGLVRDGFGRLAAAMRAAAAAGPDPLAAAARAYLDFARDQADLYQVMYGLGGVRVPAAETVEEGAAVGAVIAELLGTTDPADDRISRLWATAHGLVALHEVGKLPVEREQLHGLLRSTVDDLRTGLDRRSPHT